MSRKKVIVILITVAAIAAVVLAFVIPLHLRARANEALARELHAEFGRWLASLPHVPDSENGALVVLRGLDLLEYVPEEFYSMEEGGLAADAALAETMQKYLVRNRAALAIIEKGLGFEKWKYPVDYGKGYDAKFSHLMRMNNTAARAFMLRGEFAELEGDREKAWSEYIKVVRLGTTLTRDTAVISRLIEGALYGQGLRKLGEILSLRCLSRKTLRDTLQALQELHGRRGDFMSAMEGEYHLFAETVADAIEGDEKAGCLLSDSRFSFFQKYHDWQSEIDVYREIIKKCGSADPARFYKAPREFKDTGFLREKLERTASYTVTFIPALAGCMERLAGTEAFWRGVIALAAVRLFEAENGRLPGKFEELGGLVPAEMLIDPFSGKQLVYKLKGGDFSLYSVGVDGRDGKCEELRELFSDTADEGEPDDIIFHAPPKTEEAAPEPAGESETGK